VNAETFLRSLFLCLNAVSLDKEVDVSRGCVLIKGESYSYPESFDILVLRDSVAVKVRNGKIEDILKFEDYSYGNVPVINGRGFEIKVSSDAQVKEFLSEYDPDNADYFKKWMNFDTYRKVVFSK